ncbi:MAG: EamA family transporter [Candidatus Methanomethylophilaceae archaeon]|nr:EamA family transporter [Candidatus Methanomethylophilaceae archaeon]
MKELINGGNAKLMMIIAMSLFGTLGVSTYFIDLPASVIVVGRGLIGASFLLILIHFSGSKLSKDDIYGNMFTLICSGVCLGLNWLFLFEAYKSIEISVATVLNYLTPAMVILISPIVFKTRLTFIKLGCALLALLGLVLVTGIIENGTEEINTYGIVCGLLAAVFYTGLVVFNKKLKSIGSYDRTFVQLLIAGIVIAVYCLFTVDFGSLHPDTMSIVLLVVIAVFQTAIAFTLYFGSLAHLDAPTAVMYGYIEPVISIALSVIILHEDLGIIGWIGAALILGSTFLSEILNRRRERQSTE